MTTLTNDTLLTFTETKNGHATGKEFNNTVKGYIDAVRNAGNSDTFEQLVEPVKFDEDGEAEEFHDKFDDLTLEQQLDLCVQVNGERYASQTSYKIAE